MRGTPSQATFSAPPFPSSVLFLFLWAKVKASWSGKEGGNCAREEEAARGKREEERERTDTGKSGKSVWEGVSFLCSRRCLILWRVCKRVCVKKLCIFVYVCAIGGKEISREHQPQGTIPSSRRSSLRCRQDSDGTEIDRFIVWMEERLWLFRNLNSYLWYFLEFKYC